MNFAIIGASGNVGRKTIEILEKSKIVIDNLFLVASSKSAGKKIKMEELDHYTNRCMGLPLILREKILLIQ